MLGIGTPELIVIGILILLFYGPDRLPELLGKINRVFRDLKNLTFDAQEQINREIHRFEKDVVQLDAPEHIHDVSKEANKAQDASLQEDKSQDVEETKEDPS